MPTKKEPAADATLAPAAEPAETSVPADTVLVTEVPRKRSGLAVAGVIVGAVVVAAALFGGGVLVGTLIPTGQTQAQFGPGGDRPQGGFQGGPNGNGGPGPVMPGQGDTDTEDN